MPKTILLSAFCNDRVVAQAVELGASYFLPKPVELGALLERMETVFEKPAAPEESAASLKNLVTEVIHEIGVVDGVNGWVLPMDMHRIPIDDIYKGLKKFKYTPPADRWGELLVPGKCDEDSNRIVKVKCKRVYWDLEFKREMAYGEEWEVPMSRADKLLDLDLVDWIDG
jgi:hypothetical protein